MTVGRTRSHRAVAVGRWRRTSAALVAAVSLVAVAGCADEGEGGAPAPSGSPQSSPEGSQISASGSATATATRAQPLKSFAAVPPRAEPVLAPTIGDYLRARGLREQVIEPGEVSAVDVSIDLPAGWEFAAPGLMPEAYLLALGPEETATPEGAAVAFTPNAMVFLSRVDGPIDTNELLDHASGDLANTTGFELLDSGAASVSGYPARSVDGRYVDEDLGMLYSSHRVVVISVDEQTHYLAQLLVTAVDDGSAANADAVAWMQETFVVWLA